MPQSSIWKSTPNKKDHLTSGYTSKTLFNFQFPGGGLDILNNNEIFATIISFGENYKGTNILPANYFDCDDGRTLRISMLFDKFLNGEPIDLVIALGSDNITNAYGETGTISIYSQCELVYYVTKFNDYFSIPVLMANGKLTYNPNNDFLISNQVEGVVDATDIGSNKNITIINQSGKSTIRVKNLIVEEIS